MIIYHNPWPNAKLCMKAQIRCNILHSKVMALMSMPAAEAFVSYCNKL